MSIFFLLQVGGSFHSIKALKKECWPAAACIGSTSTNSMNCRKNFVHGEFAGLHCLHRQQPVQPMTSRYVDRGFGSQNQGLWEDIRCLLPSFEKLRLLNFTIVDVDGGDLTNLLWKDSWVMTPLVLVCPLTHWRDGLTSVQQIWMLSLSHRFWSRQSRLWSTAP